jgi:hypothetical protein
MNANKITLFSILVCLLIFRFTAIALGQNDNGIAILGSSSFKDDLGYFHVVGEVQNNSSDPMNYVEVTSTLYDSAGKVVGTEFTFTNVDVLMPRGKSSFDIVLNNAQQSEKVSNYKLSVSSERTEPLPPFLELSIGDNFIDDIGFYHIVGEVTNNGKDTATYVQVSGAFYNEDNTVVAAGFTFTEPSDIGPAQTAPFEIVVSEDEGAAEIDHASLSLDSAQYSMIREGKALS